MMIGIPKEIRPGETRVAITPDAIKKITQKQFGKVIVERGAGVTAGFMDSEYESVGAQVVDTAAAWGADIVFTINRPEESQIAKLKKGALYVCLLEAFREDAVLSALEKQGVSALALERIPRTSRAQSMDVLSSQGNIAGYRAVIEGAAQYGRFMPMMMTSGGSAKAAKVIILGVGVAGLQAIATARRLGGQVEAYDVRPDTREQVLSLGAKFIDIDIGESGAGAGGYAKELSEEGKKKLAAALNERLKKADILITTANIPGRKAPILVTSEVVKGMRPGSVIIDMAAPTGGNCELTKPGETTLVNGVKVVGVLNYAALLASDSSNFWGRNMFNLLGIMYKDAPKDAPKGTAPTFNLDFNDDILDASVVIHQGAKRTPQLKK